MQGELFHEWFAIEVDGLSEQKIFRKLRNRLFQKNTLEPGLGALPEDMAIVFEWDSCKFWYRSMYSLARCQNTNSCQKCSILISRSRRMIELKRSGKMAQKNRFQMHFSTWMLTRIGCQALRRVRDLKRTLTLKSSLAEFKPQILKSQSDFLRLLETEIFHDCFV